MIILIVKIKSYFWIGKNRGLIKKVKLNEKDVIVGIAISRRIPLIGSLVELRKTRNNARFISVRV